MTDPCHPLFGRRFPVHSVTGGDTHSACVYAVYQGDDRLKIFREATNLSVLERTSPRSKLSMCSVREFLALMKEYESCLSPLKKSGGVSLRCSRRKSSRKSI